MKLYKSIKKKKGYENKPNQNRKIQLLDYCRGGVVVNFKICVMRELHMKDTDTRLLCSGCFTKQNTVNRNMFNGLCADCTTKALYDYDFAKKAKKINEKFKKLIK